MNIHSLWRNFVKSAIFVTACISGHKCLQGITSSLHYHKVFTSRFSSGADEEENDCLFVSHLTGEDLPNCGSSRTPYRSLPQALRQVRDGGKICLDGRKSELHPYGCLRMDNGPFAVERIIIHKSVTIKGQFSEAHISCQNPADLIFGTHATGGILQVTLFNLVFNATRVILYNVCSFNVEITKCKFVNCPYGVGRRQEESLAPSCQKSTLAVSDSEFWYNTNSIEVYLFDEFFNLTISRCLFQGKKGQFNVTSEDRKTTGAVYVRSTVLRELPRMYLHVSLTDSIFRELGHEDNGFAFSVRIRHYVSDGNLTLSNTSFLKNENAVFVHGGYAIMANGPPKTTSTTPGINALLDECL